MTLKNYVVTKNVLELFSFLFQLHFGPLRRQDPGRPDGRGGELLQRQNDNRLGKMYYYLLAFAND
jgi:hypothetical protein